MLLRVRPKTLRAGALKLAPAHSLMPIMMAATDIHLPSGSSGAAASKNSWKNSSAGLR